MISVTSLILSNFGDAFKLVAAITMRRLSSSRKFRWTKDIDSRMNSCYRCLIHEIFFRSLLHESFDCSIILFFYSLCIPQYDLARLRTFRKVIYNKGFNVHFYKKKYSK